MPDPQDALQLHDIGKSYGAVDVIEGMNLSVKAGEFVVIVGPSGCGKSTLLRMIAGLEEISAGEMFMDGKRVNDVAPTQRGVAMVFQSYALYPHMTVFNNMAFGLKLARVPKAEIKLRVEAAASMLQLQSLLDRHPRHLSGGQRQRVAIGRAIVREPAIFLFDEPLSNLDAALRVRTRLEIARIHEQLGVTTIFVTHDQVEAMTLADRIIVLNKGQVEQIGSPQELYDSPANIFVAGFIGSPQMNLFATGHADDSLAAFDGQVALDPTRAGVRTVGLRPEHIQHVAPDSARFQARLVHIERLGEYRLLYCELPNGEEVVVKDGLREPLASGDLLHFAFTDQDLHYFDDQGRAAGH